MAGKKVFGYLTYADVKWASSGDYVSWGMIPPDSIPWDVLTHATLFASGGEIPMKAQYLAQLPYFTARAHQERVYAGMCYGGSGDAGIAGAIANPAQWLPWITYNIGLVDTYGLDFIELDLEGSYTLSNVQGFLQLLYDSLQVRQSANNPAVHPFVVLTVGPSRAASWVSVEPYVGFTNLMSYDYIGDWWCRLIFDCSPTSYEYFNGTGANTDYYPGCGVNSPAPSLQEAAKKVRNAGWPAEKVLVGFDANPTYYYGGSYPGGRGPTYIRQPVSSGLNHMQSNLDFRNEWPFISTIPADSIHFDQIAKAYWFHTGTSLADDKLWVTTALPGRDSAVWATRQIVDSMDIGGVMFWNLGSEIWNTSAVPPGGRGWFFHQIRKYFSGSNVDPPPVPSHKIKGEIFFDQNQNNGRDPGEKGMAGWHLTLTGPEEKQYHSDSLGTVLFEALSPGTYSVSIETKAGWTKTIPPGVYTVTLDSLTDSITVQFGLYSASAFSFPVMRNWNIISLPVTTPSVDVGYLFPLAVTPAYSFEDGYSASATIQHGEGYWMKYSTGHDVWLSGDLRTADTTIVTAGWNFLGSISTPIPVSALSAVPAGILSPYIYGYGPGPYLTSVIQPGRGYWVSVSAPGKIILSIPPGGEDGEISFASGVDSDLNKVTFVSSSGESQTLYYGKSHSGGTEFLTLPAPPEPPGSQFLASFRTQRGKSLVALVPEDPDFGSSMTIDLRGAQYPLTIEWNAVTDMPGTTLEGEGIRQTLSGSGAIELDGPGDSGGGDRLDLFSLTIGNGPDFSSVPENFILEQNYPNPFNPSTVIRFSLPAESHVRMDIFNTIGEHVAEIVDATYPAGYHSVQFAGSSLASGVYLYRVTASAPGLPRFTETKKLLLVR